MSERHLEQDRPEMTSANFSNENLKKLFQDSVERVLFGRGHKTCKVKTTPPKETKIYPRASSEGQFEFYPHFDS